MPDDIIRAGLRLHPFKDDPPYMQQEGVDWGDVEQIFWILNEKTDLRTATDICEKIQRRYSVTEEFGYGGLVMLEANKLGKPMVLLTSLRRHVGTDRTSTAGSLFGPAAFSPLVDAGLMTGREIMDDFIIPNPRALVDADKTRDEAWKKALEYARKQAEGGFERLGPDTISGPDRPKNRV
jgi:hypothetical protein